jgi:lipoyl(octanoyl) transferase
VTLHGIAINVEPELSHFSGIVPCGVSAQRYGVTSLADLGISTSMAEVDTALKEAFEELFRAAQAVGNTENASASPPTARSALLPSR